MNTPLRIASLALFASAAALCADWNPRLAADYLDARQKDWFAWPTANATGATCLSCHTSMTYLFARPALRHALNETGPTEYEALLRDSLRSRVSTTDIKALFGPAKSETSGAQALGVEAIFAALFLAPENTPDSAKAFERMWALQLREGKSKGAWAWNSLNYDPWEMPESAFYGATLAAMAVAAAPPDYRERPDVREHIASLTAYLKQSEAGQPLHNRVLLLWASAKVPGIVTQAARAAIVSDIIRVQSPDGGWSTQSLGQWKAHDTAPLSEGSSAYATAFTACVLRQSGTAGPELARAQAWLRNHQDAQTGAWGSLSMNKKYAPGSMPLRFMQDAATAFAVLALVD